MESTEQVKRVDLSRILKVLRGLEMEVKGIRAEYFPMKEPRDPAPWNLVEDVAHFKASTKDLCGRVSSREILDRMGWVKATPNFKRLGSITRELGISKTRAKDHNGRTMGYLLQKSGE